MCEDCCQLWIILKGSVNSDSVNKLKTVVHNVQRFEIDKLQMDSNMKVENWLIKSKKQII